MLIKAYLSLVTSIITDPKKLVNRVVKSCKKRAFLGVKWGKTLVFCGVFGDKWKYKKKTPSAGRQAERLKIKNAHLCSFRF